MAASLHDQAFSAFSPTPKMTRPARIASDDFSMMAGSRQATIAVRHSPCCLNSRISRSTAPKVRVAIAYGPFYLGGGFHRLGAFLSAHPDAKYIECQVHPGNRDDALLFACGTNAEHGLRRNRADKVKAVTTLIRSERWSGWSDREIARQCGVSHPFVAAVRRELETFPDAGAEPAAAEATPAPAAPVRRRTVKRRGRRYELNTARIGRNQPQRRDEIAKLKRAFERFQGELSGAIEPARKRSSSNASVRMSNPGR